MNDFKYCILLILALIIWPSTVMASTAGKLTFVSGRVDITSPEQEARPAKVGDEIRVGDIIRTKSESRAEITFLDGNILRLAHSTRLEVTEYLAGLSQKKGIFKLFRGKIQNIIKLAAGRSFGLKESNQYEVYTPTAVIGVRGTNFFTYYINGISGSVFKEGTGYTYSLNLPDEVMYIEAGQSMRVTGPDRPPVIRPATDMEIKGLEDETSPQTGKTGTETGTRSTGFSSILEQGLDEKDSMEDRLIKEGIDQEMKGMDRFERGIEIPQQLPEPDHHHQY